MPLSDQKLSRPVSLGDIASCIHSQSDLSRSANINPFAKYKPLRAGITNGAELSYAQRKALNWGYCIFDAPLQEPPTMNLMEVVKYMVYGTIPTGLGIPSNSMPLWDSGATPNGWYYLRQTSADRARMLDFVAPIDDPHPEAGYQHDIDRSLVQFYPNSGTTFILPTSESFDVSIWNESGKNKCDIRDLGLTNTYKYFGVCVIKTGVSETYIDRAQYVRYYVNSTPISSITGGIRILVETNAEAKKFFSDGEGSYLIFPFLTAVSGGSNLNDGSQMRVTLGSVLPVPSPTFIINVLSDDPTPVGTVTISNFAITGAVTRTFAFRINFSSGLRGKDYAYTLQRSTNPDDRMTGSGTLPSSGSTLDVSRQSKNYPAEAGATWTLTVSVGSNIVTETISD